MAQLDPKVARVARGILADLQVAAEVEDAADTACYVLCVLDPEHDHRRYYGPYSDPVEALSAAESFETDLNQGIGSSEPYRVTVERVLKR